MVGRKTAALALASRGPPKPETPVWPRGISAARLPSDGDNSPLVWVERTDPLSFALTLVDLGYRFASSPHEQALIPSAQTVCRVRPMLPSPPASPV